MADSTAQDRWNQLPEQIRTLEPGNYTLSYVDRLITASIIRRDENKSRPVGYIEQVSQWTVASWAVILGAEKKPVAVGSSSWTFTIPEPTPTQESDSPPA